MYREDILGKWIVEESGTVYDFKDDGEAEVTPDGGKTHTIEWRSWYRGGDTYIKLLTTVCRIHVHQPGKYFGVSTSRGLRIFKRI